jgi:asparagine synthase (glutamine-hydrolysing)
MKLNVLLSTWVLGGIQIPSYYHLRINKRSKNMCGILGVYGAGKGKVDQAIFDHALGLLHHRGPDGSRTWSGGNVILGHARLAIVDLSAEASQPMEDLSSRYHIVHNGEIYNYKELREELEKSGAVFHTRSDTEVILEAYKCWGVKCQEHFNGMWAFAIYDREKDELFLSRDRYGVKPIYYASLEDTLVFASEMKALLDLGVDSEPDWSEVNRFLQEWSNGTGENTPFKNIRQLPAGHYVLITLSGQRLVRWWYIAERLVEVPKRFRERVEYFRELFEDAVRLRLRNDVDTGVTLSGGMDSGSIYGAARKLSMLDRVHTATTGEKKNFRVFTLSYPGSALDEYKWVDQNLRFWLDETPPEVICPSVNAFPDTVDEIIWRQEIPRWTIAVMIYDQLYQRIASTGTKVVLEGHRGDELFGGYREEIRQAVHTYAAHGNLLRAWRSSLCLRDMLNLTSEEPSLKAWKIFLQALPGKNLLAAGASRAGLHFRKERGESIFTARTRYFRPPIVDAAPMIHPESVSSFSPYLQSLYLQFTQRYLPTMIQVFDRAAMTHSVESRLPFLDHRIVQYAFSLPDEDKVKRRTKVIVRQAAKEWLPEGVRNRRVKTGYNTPDSEWFESPVIYNYMRDIFNSRDALQSELFDGKLVAGDLERLRENGYTRRDAVRIWRVFNIYKWNRLVVEPYRR